MLKFATMYELDTEFFNFTWTLSKVCVLRNFIEKAWIFGEIRSPKG